MSKAEPTCENRIDAHLVSLVTSIKEFNKAIKEGFCADRFFDENEVTCEDCIKKEECKKKEKEYDDSIERTHPFFYENVLGVEFTKIVKVQLSYGGPEDYVLAHYYMENGFPSFTQIEYCFKDWFDGAVRTLKDKEFDLVAAALSDYIVFED